MGHKRKASDPLSPFSPSISSPFHYETNPHPFFPSPVPRTFAPAAISACGPSDPYLHPNIPNPSPYSSSDDKSNHLNSRTRKRFRDNRPDEETIHRTTLSKLYAAQQHEQKRENQDHSISLTPSPNPSHRGLPNPTPTSNTNQPKQKSQVSLHAFFGGSGGEQHRSTTLPDPDPHPPSNTTARCEDCSAPLHLSSTSRNTTRQDTEMMDIDMDDLVADISSSGDQGSAYACAKCSRRVCDICAVRGDHRVCLECANPGNGNAYVNGHGYTRGGGMGGSCGMEVGSVYGHGGGSVGGGEKRWVGGIGWM